MTVTLTCLSKVTRAWITLFLNVQKKVKRLNILHEIKRHYRLFTQNSCCIRKKEEKNEIFSSSFSHLTRMHEHHCSVCVCVLYVCVNACQEKMVQVRTFHVYAKVTQMWKYNQQGNELSHDCNEWNLQLRVLCDGKKGCKRREKNVIFFFSFLHYFVIRQSVQMVLICLCQLKYSRERYENVRS